MSSGPQRAIWGGFEIHGDDTLPPDHVKMLNGEKASVFKLDLCNETSELVAEWPERLSTPTSSEEQDG